jgi:hypothetical protein
MGKEETAINKEGLVDKFVEKEGVARDIGRQVIENLGDGGCQILARVYRGDPPEEYEQALAFYGEGYSELALVDMVLVRRDTGEWPQFDLITEIVR